MNVLGVGPLELVVILIVALVFVGPERLPRLAADLARTIREIRKYTGDLAAEFTEVIQDFEKDTENERSEWKEIGAGLTGATQSVTDAIRGARADAEGSPGGAPALPSAANGTVDAHWVEIPEPADAAANAPQVSAGEPTTNGNSAQPEPAEEVR